jgi:sigma-B regulation protein RsbU (phosphoserine phosphatase)
MRAHDLLRLADLALAGQLSSQLPEELLALLARATGARAGCLERSGDAVARWPPGSDSSADTSAEGWALVPLSAVDDGWSVHLLYPQRLDEELLTSARLTLSIWSLREELKKSRFDERFRLWELEAVRSIAASIGGILDDDRLADELIAHLVSLLGVRSAHLYREGQSRLEPVGGFGSPAMSAAELARLWGQSVFEAERIAAPISSHSGVLGMVVLGAKEARAGTEPFSSNDQRLLEMFAAQAAVAFENARLYRESLEKERLRRELEVAAAVQSHLYPRGFPDFPGVRVAARSRPSRQVGGDSFDVSATGDLLLATVADVSGKGVGAGMLAAGIHAGVRLMADIGLPLPEVAARLNRYLHGATPDNRFATFATMSVAADGAIGVVNAGHCPVLLVRRDGSVETIESSGLPIGLLAANTVYREESNALAHGDLVLIYTDGVTEAENADEEELGVERLVEVARQLAGGTAEEVCAGVLEAVETFTGGSTFADDVTLLVVERLG